MNTNVKLHNKFDFEIYDMKKKETRHAYAENIVLNRYPIPTTSFYAYIQVGSGTGTLNPTRTTLFNYVGNISRTLVEANYINETSAYRKVKGVFDETVLNNTVWTEVGLASSSSSSLNTHALIKDSEGNPITIEKTSTRIVTIHATIYCELVDPPQGHYLLGFGSYNPMLQLLVRGSMYYSGSYSGKSYYALAAYQRADGAPSLLGLSRPIYSVSYSTDTTNNRYVYASKRYGVSDGNGPVRGFVLGYTPYKSGACSYRIGGTSIPLAGLHEGQVYQNVSIGVGDGVTSAFDFPVALVKPLSETLRLGGVVLQRDVDYVVTYGNRSTDTTVIDTTEIGNMGYDGSLDETVKIPQPPDEYMITSGSLITGIEFKNRYVSSSGYSSYDIKLSEDGVTFEDVGSGNLFNYQVVTLTLPTPKKYKFMKLLFTNSNGYDENSLEYFKVYSQAPSTKNIVFTTPPVEGVDIHADFAIDYINKTTSFVLDVQSEIQWGNIDTI